MEIYALFDDTSCEKIDFALLKPGSKTNVIEITYLNSVPDNQRESFDMGVKESYFQLIDYCDNMPEKISIWFKGLSKNARGNSTDLAFAISLSVQLIKKGILSASKDIGIISATGVINKDGQIGGVSGLKSKVLASLSVESNRHNHILFYPKANQSDLETLRKEDEDFDQKIKNSGIRLVPVNNLKNAFDHLCIEKTNIPGTKANKLKIALIVLPLLSLGAVIAGIIIFKNIYLKNNAVSKLTDLYDNKSTSSYNLPTVSISDTKLKSTITPSKIITQSMTVTPALTASIAPSFSTPMTTDTYTPTLSAGINMQRNIPSPELKLKAAVSLNKDNSLTVTFNNPVNNSKELYGAMNVANYKLINMPSADGEAEIAKVTELEPNIKYKIIFPELITTDSFDFKLKLGNIAQLDDKASFTEESIYSFKTRDTKSPSIIKGPVAIPFGSQWKIRFTFSEQMDENSTKDLSNYGFVDDSKDEVFFLTELENTHISLLRDKKTVEITLHDVEPEKDKLKVYFVTDNSHEKNQLDKEDIDNPIIIKKMD
jgi:hypothetical protein